MLKLLIKLAVAALIANAVWRVGAEHLTFYRFKDDVRNAATFRKGGDEELRLRIEQMAADYDVPLDADALKISSDQSQAVNQSVIELSYLKPIELFPGFLYSWPFSFEIDTVYSRRF